MRAAAQTFRTNPALDTEAVITALGVGEALVSVLDEKGSPSIVQQIWVRPPDSQMGPLTDAERAAMIAASPLKGAYDEAVDRESAYELLQKQVETLVV
ncbi:helicase HerA-like domain-containing protein [Halopseudomonas pachastrellae]|nr:helicase HerA-like domain-containing protein [Halopseudomonas pachastrellae]